MAEKKIATLLSVDADKNGERNNKKTNIVKVVIAIYIEYNYNNYATRIKKQEQQTKGGKKPRTSLSYEKSIINQLKQRLMKRKKKRQHR